MQINPVSNIPFKGSYSVDLSNNGKKLSEEVSEEQFTKEIMAIATVIGMATNLDEIQEACLLKDCGKNINFVVDDSDDKEFEKTLSSAGINFDKIG